LSEHEVLVGAGVVSHAIAEQHATAELKRFQVEQRVLQAPESGSDFDRAVRRMEGMSRESGV